MLKKIFKIIGRLFLIVLACLIVFLSIEGNLKEYTVYYAKRMPHREGTDPVLALSIRNSCYIPVEDTKTFQKVKFENAMDFFNSNGRQIGFACGDTNYVLVSIEPIMYDINPTFSSAKKSTGNFDNYTVLDSKDKEFQQLKERLYVLMQPLLEQDGPPPLDLQPLFNLKYGKEFE